MKPYYEDDWVTLYHGDCRSIFPELPDSSMHAVITDPPYDLGILGREWDRTGVAFDPDIWRDLLRTLKPGGHILAFGGTRTWHRMASAIEEAGFEIRDSIAWLYGSGMPKSHNLLGEWIGWGTALKPAFEPIVVGRKPLAGTTAANVSAHGTGALHIDATRIGDGSDRSSGGCSGSTGYEGGWNGGRLARPTGGRWPTNVALCESQAEVLAGQPGARPTYFPIFQFHPKAPPSERPVVSGVKHVTVKPLGLMRWLARLVTPPGGVILDPFAGSGTTGEAAMREGFRSVLIETEPGYLPLIEQRIDRAHKHPSQDTLPLGEVS